MFLTNRVNYYISHNLNLSHLINALTKKNSYEQKKRKEGNCNTSNIRNGHDDDCIRTTDSTLEGQIPCELMENAGIIGIIMDPVRFSGRNHHTRNAAMCVDPLNFLHLIWFKNQKLNKSRC